MCSATKSFRGLAAGGSIAALGAASLLGGCNNAGQGALTGAGLGAAGGAIIGSLYGDAGAGAAIGAVSGGLTGGVIGDQNARRSAYGYAGDGGVYYGGSSYSGWSSGTTYYVPGPEVHVYYEYARPRYYHHHHHYRSHRHRHW